ncbi:Armadillo-like helical-containing protein [Dioscorea alata]|uniref:Armadillo-like helical-containing protein n=1 Tax=Dioscorea alata TaxID=55571 RepID=A0ACB7VAU9_DIOAL|nr:Armadillo-like helical-containing protein [Dioscorea alata]
MVGKMMSTGGDPSRPQPGTAAGGGGIPARGGVWTAEEDNILREGLERHYGHATVAACVEIAAALPGKTIIDVGLRCDWLLVAEKITDLSNDHVLRPLAHISSDDNGEVRRNLLDSTEDILKKVGENPQANENMELLYCALKNIIKFMEYYWSNDAQKCAEKNATTSCEFE